MHAALQQNQFFVKEHVGLFKAANNYDIFDPVSQQKVLACREPDPTNAGTYADRENAMGSAPTQATLRMGHP